MGDQIRKAFLLHWWTGTIDARPGITGWASTKEKEEMTERRPDPRALRVAQQVHEMARPLATILFVSRARGDHREDSSDIDILLVGEVPDTCSGRSRRYPTGPTAGQSPPRSYG